MLLAAAVAVALVVASRITERNVYDRWVNAQKEDSISGYEEFLRNHKQSAYTRQVQTRLSQLSFKKAEGENTAKAFSDFLERFPDASDAPSAKAKLPELNAWESALSSGTMESLRDFRASFPNSSLINAAWSKELFLASEDALNRLSGTSLESVTPADIVWVLKDGKIDGSLAKSTREIIMHATVLAMLLLDHTYFFSIASAQPNKDGQDAGQITVDQHQGAFLYNQCLPSEFILIGLGMLGPPGAARSGFIPPTAPGSVYRFRGLLKDFVPGWTIQAEEGQPLCFVLLENKGLTYFCGRGSVTSPDGKTTLLPSIPSRFTGPLASRSVAPAKDESSGTQFYSNYNTPFLPPEEKAAIETTVIKDELKNSLMLKNNMKEVAAQDWLSAAVSYASQGGRFKQALVCIDSAIEMDTNDANAWALKAAIQVARGENQAALQSAEQATRIDPKNVRALNSKANALAALGRDPEALTIIEEALAYQPINPPVLFTKVVILYNKGLALATAGNLNEALKCYDEALEGAKNKDIESKPEIAKVWFGRGSVLGLMERRVEALASLDRAIQIDPSHVEAWVHKGLETYQLGDGEKALEYLNKALELDGRSAMAWHNKAVVLHGLKRFEDALACCERTTDLDPSNALVWLQKARALQGLGRSNAEITAAVKKAASLGNPDAIELLSNSPGK